MPRRLTLFAMSVSNICSALAACGAFWRGLRRRVAGIRSDARGMAGNPEPQAIDDGSCMLA